MPFDKMPPNAIGPFKGSEKPVRPGLYARRSPRTGNRVFAHFDGQTWMKYATVEAKAVSKGRARRRSKHQELEWYGVRAPAVAGA